MKKNFGAWLAIAATILLLFVYYNEQITDASYLNYGQWGDGYKNYYTLAYYLQNDHGTHFTGMNYPYGENVIFTDNQPVIGWILKPVCKVFPALANNIRALLAVFIFLSIVFSAYLVYRILREFEVRQWIAALFATLIAVMAPQLLRLMGHFALGYGCFLPLVFFLLVRYFKTGGRYRIFAYLTLTLTFFTFIHIYYTAMAGMFILLIAGMYGLFHIRELKKHIRFISLLVVSAIIPFVALKSYLYLFDHIKDRPHSPWGFIESRATAADIFLHRYSFSAEVIGQILPKANIVYHFEGTGYIGLVAIVTLLSLLVLTVVSFKKTKALHKQYYLYTFMLPAVMVLLFAMAFPFSIPGLEQYYDRMPGAIKQFRASGRFNWVFYFTATIYTAVLIHHLYNHLLGKHKKILAGLLIATAVSVWFVEMNMIANRYEKDFKQGSNKIDEEKEKEELLQQFKNAGIDVNNFQAILSFPFFLNGSERIYLDHPTAFEAMKTSLYTGLPIAGTKLSRSSEYQTFRLANLLSSPYIKKEVIKEFHNQKPLLLLACENNFSPVEWSIINKGKLLFTMNDKKYFELPLSAFDDSTAFAKQYFAEHKSTLFNHGEYLSDDSTNNVVSIRYENELNQYAPFGKGAHYIENGIAPLFDGTLPNAKDNERYVMSIWSLSDERRAAFPFLYTNQLDSMGNEIERYDANPKFSTNTDGKWVRTEIEFTLYNKHNKFTMYGNDRFQSYDELMIRPKNVTVITAVENNGTFLYNNFPIR